MCSSSDSCLIRVWNVATARSAGTLGGPTSGLWAVAYSPDGKRLACGGYDKALHLLDAATGTERLVPDVVDQYVRTLSFAADGASIATGGSGSTCLWDPTTRAKIPTKVPLPEGLCPVFLPGDKELVGWNHGEARIVVCQLPSGEVQATWQAHPKHLEEMAVSPDGRFLASCGAEGVARLWSRADQTEVATLKGRQGAVLSAAFAPDGARPATGGQDDFSIHIWDLPAVCRVAR